MGKKQETMSLGRAVIKDRFRSGRKKQGNSNLHTTDVQDGYDWNKINLKSTTEENTLDEFLATAELAGTDFTAEKLNYAFVLPANGSEIPSAEQEAKTKLAQDSNREQLKVPRRPAWNETTTPEELDQSERDAFLEWRRSLAKLQDVEGLIMTPYERNLDFWRQLWRVIERSDIVVQIVDARNPLLFRCEDLEVYVKEVGDNKINMLLVNKADLLTEAQRKAWAEYFEKLNIRVAFWSAVEEMERIKLEASQASHHSVNDAHDRSNLTNSDEDDDDEDDEDDDDDDDDDEENEGDSEEDDDDDKKCENDALPIASECKMISKAVESPTALVAEDDDDDEWTDVDSDEDADEDVNILTKEVVSKTTSKVPCKASTTSSVACSKTGRVEVSGKARSQESAVIKNDSRLLTGHELIGLFKSIHRPHSERADEEGLTVVGMVGYPNVGKSSTVNAMLQTKKVPVSATPGRTKHYQTLFLDPTIMLCDCPGLVMPTFVSTKAEMVTNGILPIDQMRDYVPPVSLVCKHVPRDDLETVYGIMLPEPGEEEENPDRPPTAHELLGCHASIRGFMTHKGIPDFQRSARHILKDFVNGKILYCHPPPGISEEEFGAAATTTTKKKKVRPAGSVPPASVCVNGIDQEFLHRLQGINVGSKGVGGVVGFTRKDGHVTHHAPPKDADASEVVGKPWKKHNNIKKKEKLKRLHGYMDA